MINAERIARDVIVVGASAGGVEAIMRLLGSLPAKLKAAVAVVLHRSPFFETRLAEVLGRSAALPVMEPVDGHRIEPGLVLVAPRDQHMFVDDGHVRLSRGPKEHRTRPAIDPLFRSASQVYGPRVAGVLLSGMGADGVSGLIDIKAAGGLSLVQSPAEAIHPVMPKNAIAEDHVDGVLRLEDLATALVALAAGEAVKHESPNGVER